MEVIGNSTKVLKYQWGRNNIQSIISSVSDCPLFLVGVKQTDCLLGDSKRLAAFIYNSGFSKDEKFSVFLVSKFPLIYISSWRTMDALNKFLLFFFSFQRVPFRCISDEANFVIRFCSIIFANVDDPCR